MFLWHCLKNVTAPILIYGMGNGAEKILTLTNDYDIPVTGVFSSDDHARAVAFQGYPVLSLKEVMEAYENAVILVAFGSYDETVLNRIEALSKQYTVLIPDLPLMGGDILTPDSLLTRQEEIRAARGLLADDKSHRVFDTMLEAKLSGLLEPHFREDTLREDDFSLLSLTHGEDYLDLGAYNGDTIQEFLSHTGGKYCSITALEPDAHNYKKLSEFTASLPRTRILPCASWCEPITLTFSGKGGRNCAVKPDLPGQYRHLHPVDAIPVDALELRVSFAKLDVEGAESQTLMGMKNTLTRCRPKLLISAYHKPDDFITLPLLLEQLCPGYKIYMRRNRCLPAWEIQLYCIPAEIDKDS